MKISSFFGLVSNSIPLLQSTSAYENISLVNRYNINQTECNKTVEKLFRSIGLDQNVFYKVPIELNEREKFFTMLIRACFVNGIVVIDKPSRLLEHDDDSDFFDECLNAIDGFYSKISLFDTKSNMNWYKKQYA